MTGIDIHLSPLALGTLALLAAVALLSLAAYTLLPRTGPAPDFSRWIEALGLAALPRWIFGLGAFLWLVLLLTFLAGLLWVIASVACSAFPRARPPRSRPAGPSSPSPASPPHSAASSRFPSP